MNKKTILVMSTFVLSACSSMGTYVDSNLLQPKMTKQQVISALGALPDKKQASGKKERYEYANLEVCFDENGLLFEADSICTIY